jgi:hypothetical protein
MCGEIALLYCVLPGSVSPGIERSDVFMFVLSKVDQEAEVCNWEVEHAVRTA